LRGITLLLIAVVVLALFWAVVPSSAQVPDASDGSSTAKTDAADGKDKKSDSPRGFWGILMAGGPVGVIIMLLSVGAVALVVEHLMTIREPVLIPPNLGEEVRELLGKGQVGAARKRCRMEPSFLAYVMEAGLNEVDGGWAAVEKATEDAAADQSARLFRKIEYLSVIGNIAPMLGLLGTVIGMIFAFREVSDAQGAARAADLAKGIYLALVTTVEGLIVAIPSLAAFAVFRNRVDQLVAETAYVVQHVFAPLKRALAAGKPQPPITPPPPPAGGA